ncbi:uncharacterized protein YndB with AHSA1/START domain [Thermocatellispora tengchongensis]|uniref:Uncharacterized protein YndB with AHSA1/START domain n=1 Tax=Thermocatellispora tengchongensis TaxID=1073253 RepID=A0A840PRJ7_9ACTN|nr:SRPBCC domain-containing protein [Thermocatellispora tengchongensis]MBB5140410.1 uncharacterized protein YndB with AHSA1/START domain [Thermocatellispora tengchongensis]
MAHEFDLSFETTVTATPEQVWDAIATGPGVDSWFMGRSQFEPREGGVTRQEFMGETSEATITAWEPGRRLAYQSEKNPDGTFMAFEYLIEGRGGGSTVIRLVHSGALGDDWEAEYHALREGDAMYLRKLAAYVTHFSGRSSQYNIFLVGPQVHDQPRAWGAFGAAFGLTGPVSEGDRARLSIPGLPETEGVVEFALNDKFLGVRTADALLVCFLGFQDTVIVQQHNFSAQPEEKEAEQAWQSWLATTFA